MRGLLIPRSFRDASIDLIPKTQISPELQLVSIETLMLFSMYGKRNKREAQDWGRGKQWAAWINFLPYRSAVTSWHQCTPVSTILCVKCFIHFFFYPKHDFVHFQSAPTVWKIKSRFSPFLNYEGQDEVRRRRDQSTYLCSALCKWKRATCICRSRPWLRVRLNGTQS